MAYSTVTDLKNYIPEEQLRQLSDDNDVDSIDQEKITDSIRRADDLIDGHLRGRYPLPLTTVPSLIQDLSTKLAAYFLFKRSLLITLPEPVKDDYTDAMSILSKVQRGMITPFVNTNDEPTFFLGNKKASDNVTAAITNNWDNFLI